VFCIIPGRLTSEAWVVNRPRWIDCARSVPEPEQNIYLPSSKKKQGALGFLGSTPFWSALELTRNQRVRSLSLRRP